MRIFIKGARVIDPVNNIDKIADIFIDKGVIEDVGDNLGLEDIEAEVIDAKGLIAAPGLVDMHCHLRQPGQEYKEDIESGTKSAAMGGFTSIACMPNTNPVIDNAGLVEYIKSEAKKNGVVNVYPIGAITKGLNGEELAEIGELKFSGAVAVSDDGKPVMNPAIMRNAMQYAKTFDMAVISHCEDIYLAEDGYMNQGYNSTILGLRGITRAAEEVMLSREVILAQTDNLPIHIAHVSTKNSVEIIRQAKKQGVKVTCETCPHYFTLTDDAVLGFNTNAKVNPPLRTMEDVEAIMEGLADGTIDVIATDHAPHHIDEKRCEFANAANGIVGFETALSLTITYLVEKNILSIKQLIEKLSVNPANILGLGKGSLSIGKSADIVLIDPNKKYIVDVSNFKSKGKNSPFNGFELKGKAEYTIVGGDIVVRQGVLLY